MQKDKDNSRKISYLVSYSPYVAIIALINTWRKPYSYGFLVINRKEFVIESAEVSIHLIASWKIKPRNFYFRISGVVSLHISTISYVLYINANSYSKSMSVGIRFSLWILLVLMSAFLLFYTTKMLFERAIYQDTYGIRVDCWISVSHFLDNGENGWYMTNNEHRQKFDATHSLRTPWKPF